MKMKWPTRLLTLLLVVMLLVGGCASGSHRMGASYWPEEFPHEAVSAVAEHLADVMAASYPPGYTAFYLAGTANQKDELAPALEEALRARGFTLSPEPGEQALTLVYVLDRADEELWYSSAKLSDGLKITRTWRWTGDSLLMEAGTRTERAENIDGQQ